MPERRVLAQVDTVRLPVKQPFNFRYTLWKPSHFATNLEQHSRDTSWRIGALLGESGTTDVVDACVAVCAPRLNHCPVITSDPEDIGKLDPTLPLIAISTTAPLQNSGTVVGRLVAGLHARHDVDLQSCPPNGATILTYSSHSAAQ